MNYKLPIDASQKQCSKCLPSTWTHALRWRGHWRIAATVVEWSILAYSVWHFVYQQQRHNVTTMSSHKVRVAQVWWLSLIFELATVSIIHVQKNSNYQSNHIKVVMRKQLASFLWTQCTEAAKWRGGRCSSRAGSDQDPVNISSIQGSQGRGPYETSKGCCQYTSSCTWISGTTSSHTHQVSILYL